MQSTVNLNRLMENFFDGIDSNRKSIESVGEENPPQFHFDITFEDYSRPTIVDLRETPYKKLRALIKRITSMNDFKMRVYNDSKERYNKSFGHPIEIFCDYHEYVKHLHEERFRIDSYGLFFNINHRNYEQDAMLLIRIIKDAFVFIENIKETLISTLPNIMYRLSCGNGELSRKNLSWIEMNIPTDASISNIKKIGDELGFKLSKKDIQSSFEALRGNCADKMEVYRGLREQGLEHIGEYRLIEFEYSKNPNEDEYNELSVIIPQDVECEMKINIGMLGQTCGCKKLSTKFQVNGCWIINTIDDLMNIMYLDRNSQHMMISIRCEVPLSFLKLLLTSYDIKTLDLRECLVEKSIDIDRSNELIRNPNINIIGNENINVL